MKEITIIGAGNIAHWFASVLQRHGVRIQQIYSRTAAHATALANTCDAQPITNLAHLNNSSDCYLFALADNCYDSLLPTLPFKLPLAVHTAGSLPITLLQPYADHYGIVYPYQTVSKTLDFSKIEVPLAVEGDCPKTEQQLTTLAELCSPKVYHLNEKQRLALHLAAVFACNFTNAMYGIAHNILTEANLDWAMILPLLQNTLDKTKLTTPQAAQTGPAKRGDHNVMAKHCAALNNPELKEIYQQISHFIATKR